LPPETRSAILDRVRTFEAFDAKNRELGDFGKFQLAGTTYCFELERSRLDGESHNSGNSWDTARVLTIMRDDEY
jgi:Protein of unknown function (DUF3768)